MSATNTFETNILKLIFQNVDHPLIGDAVGLRGSTTAGVFYLSLHTADPGETGSQTTSETAYTPYARVAVARSAAGWTVTGNTADNAAVVNFAECTAGSSTITHFGVGSDASGVGNLFFSAALDASLAVSVGIRPSFEVGAVNVTAD